MDDADYLKVKGSVWEANAIKLPADPPPPPPPPPDEHADGTIYTVTTFSTDAVQTALNNCNPYDVVQLLPGKYVRGLTTVRVPDYVRLRGAGIYKQSVPGGDGGTWLDASLRWGSFCRIGVAGNANKGFLCGYNQAGRGSLHFAEWKGTTQPKFPYTTAHGCEGTQLNYVRFKGGGDGTLYTVQLRLAGGAPGATVQYRGDGGELFGNGNGYRRYWKSDSLSGAFLVDCKFTDCEFERPQGSSLVSQPFPFASGCAYVKTNSDGSTQLAPNINWPHGNPGSLCDIWVDSRAGGNEVRGNVWERCHFGVRNHYISGTDGYGMGITLLNQPCPTQPQDLSLYATRPEEFGWSLDGGSAINSRSVNKTFDRSQITHCPRDNSWVDCLFEWSTWVPIDICDWARNFSTATGSLNWLAGDYGNVPEYYTIDGVTRPTHALYGWGNPPGANWTQIPEQFWTSSLFRRCYVKGRIDKSSSSIGEVGTMMIEYCYQAQGIFGNNIEKVTPTGTFSYGGYRIPGGLPSGEWPPADTGLRHPVSAIFNVDWTGGVTAYTPSPFD